VGPLLAAVAGILELLMTQDVLPDSRAKDTKARIFTPTGTWIPVFCANCGVHGGSCPEESTFLFYLCNACFKTYGEIAGTMAVPDKEFYDKIVQEQDETYGRQLSHNELLQVVQEDSTRLATLLKEAK
jgi:hypothetical protein